MSTFDYTSRDYASIQDDLLRRAQTQLPEWTNREPSDFGMVLVDLWSYMGDILHYYVDRAAGEAFLNTATQRESVLAIANLLDYVPSGRRAATASITLNANATSATDTAPIYIPKYTRFLATPLVDTASPVVFTTNTALAFTGTAGGASVPLVDLDGITYATYAKNQDVTAFLTEGEIFSETYTSTGLSGQQVTLRKTGVVTDGMIVTVNEGPSGADVQYTYVPRLITATSSQRVFSVDITADNFSVLTFGNAVNGRIPLVNSTITITYRRSRGSAGNVASQAINRIESNTVAGKPSLDGLVVTPNTLAATGGVDVESITSLKANIPAAFRSQDRAVSLQDYIDIVKRVPGVVKSTAWVDGSNVVQVRAVVPQSNFGATNPIVLNAATITAITDYLTPREMAFASSNVGASVSLSPVKLTANLQVMAGYVQEDVQSKVFSALEDLFSFDNVDFDVTVGLGTVYRTALAIEGVDYFTVTNFTTTAGTAVIDSSGTFIGVTPTVHTLLAKSESWTITPSGGLVATGG